MKNIFIIIMTFASLLITLIEVYFNDFMATLGWLFTFIAYMQISYYEENKNENK